MVVYMVSIRENKIHEINEFAGFQNGGIFSTQEKAKFVCDRENKKEKNIKNNLWFSYCGVDVNDDFLSKFNF